ncbi:MBG domain-containing protein [Reichenbachiella ulvae]|uniref:MBG domain-containing protein n=1 Tax=Reichenbachiella ulvae TaxID=2980104 RepID=A0ABT3CTT0_9BACT|nr:MBG domain-containing protein [Reichenbachiella ulvae]MCV9387111.1 MBG domain-containing protein [Reichenbachiella ulvae]
MRKIYLNLFFLLLAFSVMGQVPTAGLVGEYRFSQGSYEDTAGDADLVATGTTLAPTDNRAGGANKALNLAGDYLQRSGFSHFDNTVSFWIKTTTNDTNKRVIIDQSERSSEAETSSQTGYYVYLQNGVVGVAGNFQWRKQVVNIVSGSVYEQTGFTGYLSTSATTNIADGNWHHVAVTIFTNGGERQNGTQIKATYKVYVDNVLEATQDQIYNAPDHSWSQVKRFTNAAYPVTIANSKDGNSTSNYREVIDDVRFYSSSLDATAVGNLFAETACVSSTGVNMLAQDITVTLNAEGAATITAEEVDNGSSDTCGDPVSLSLDISSFTCDNLGENTVTLTGEDAQGNLASTTAIVTIVPHIEAVDVTLALDETGNATLSIENVDTTPFSNCSSISYTFSQSDFTCTDIGTQSVTITANFGSGQTVDASVNLTIEDQAVPQIVVQNATVTLDASTNSANIVTADVSTSISDNCTTTPLITLSQSTFGCSELGENTVTITVTDDHGNVATADAVVTVLSPITDQALTASATDVCTDGSDSGITISTASSETGFNYFLRNSLDNSVIEGPIAGTGAALDFNVGALTESTTFNVFAEPNVTSDYALEFAKGNQQVVAGEDAAFNYDQGFTVEAWVNAPFNIANSNGMVSYGTASASDLEIYVQGTTGYLTIVFNRTTSPQTYFQYPKPPSNRWTHIAVSYDGGTSGVKVYYDGVEQSNVFTHNPGGSLIKNTGSTLNIGRVLAWGDGNDSFEGKMDEVRIWNDVRTASEISSQMNAALTGAETGLQTYYNFNEGSGTTLGDSKGTNDGALSNMDPATDWVEGALAQTACGYQMTDEITIGDQTAPTAVTQDITINLDQSGNGTITADQINSGSSDNCTSPENLVLSLDVSAFTRDNEGENVVVLTVTDDAGNSSTANATVTVIGKLNQTITFPSIETKNYGVSAFDLMAITDASGLSVSYAIVSGPATLSGSTLTVTGVGTIIVEASQSGDDTYNAATPVQVSFDVVPAELTVTANSQVHEYSGVVPSFTYSIAGFVNGETEENLNVLPSVTSNANAGVGSYVLSVSGASADNYTFVYVDGTLEITPAPLTATADDQVMIYGSAMPTLTITYTGFVNGEDESHLSNVPSVNVNTDGQVGVYDIVLSNGIALSRSLAVATQSNYQITMVNGQLTINPSELSVTADDQSMIYGEEVPVLTYSYAGFVNGDSEVDLITPPVVSTTATSDSDVGSYPITLSGAESNNYNITYTEANLTIGKATAIITFADLEQHATGEALMPTVTTDPSGLTLNITFNGDVTVPTEEGSYEVVATIDDVNYEGQATATFIILEAILSTIDKQNLVTVYPNPARDFIRVAGVEGGELMLFDLQGQMMKRSPLSSAGNSLNLTGLNPGLYLLQIVDENARLIAKRKIIVR